MRWPIATKPRWTRWFAWHPVRIGDERVWLEWIEREFVGADIAYYCNYRFPEPVWTVEDRLARPQRVRGEGY